MDFSELFHLIYLKLREENNFFFYKIICLQPVDTIMLDGNQRACGVVLEDGTEIRSKMVLSNATARLTYLNLTPQEALPKEFIQEVKAIDYKSPVAKINGKFFLLFFFNTIQCYSHDSNSTGGPLLFFSTVVKCINV